MLAILHACGGGGGSDDDEIEAELEGKAAGEIVIRGRVRAAKLGSSGAVLRTVSTATTDEDGEMV